jgi:DNA-binding winged helix-turn-helix (wHTH) protein
MTENILYVQMFGGFSMTYQGKRLTSHWNQSSKMTQLLQIILLHPENGVSKDTILHALYRREAVENSNASLNNTIFRLRKHLEKIGLAGGGESFDFT